MPKPNIFRNHNKEQLAALIGRRRAIRAESDAQSEDDSDAKETEFKNRLSDFYKKELGLRVIKPDWLALIDSQLAARVNELTDKPDSQT